MVKGILVGVLAGAVCAGIWAAIIHYANMELGILAWAVGGAVGFGVALGVQDARSILTGIAAVLIAAASIVGGKFVAAELATSKTIGELVAGFTATDHDLIVARCDEIAEQREARGTPVVWPNGHTIETATQQEDYPPDIWAAGFKAVNAMDSTAREAERQKMELEYQTTLERGHADIRMDIFKGYFDFFDILWLLLAGVTAFRLGGDLD